MSSTHILRSVPIVRSARVMQLEGLFGLPPSDVSAREWQVDLALPKEWHIGLIVGPSGSGKSTVAREIFGDAVVEAQDWPEQQSVIDAFPTEMGIKQITALLSSVCGQEADDDLRGCALCLNSRGHLWSGQRRRRFWGDAEDDIWTVRPIPIEPTQFVAQSSE